MMMRAAARPLVALMLLSACMLGKSAGDYTPAKGPAGAMVSLELTGQPRIRGELLAVEERTLLILQGLELTRVTFQRIRSGQAPNGGFRGQVMTSNVRERLRLISRYPQGVSTELEARLLKAYGTTAVREIT
jgi:hypothetical protein